MQQAEDCDADAVAGALDDLYVTEPDLAWCTCGEDELPGLGAGVQASNSLLASVNAQTSISSTPDVS